MRLRFLLMAGALASAVWAWTGQSLAATHDDFNASTVQNLVNLCAAGENDPLREAAIHFCEGYLAGAYQYHVAVTSGPNARPIVCLPNPRPTRIEAIQKFIAWARANPQYINEPAIDGLFKFGTDTWPCPRSR